MQRAKTPDVGAQLLPLARVSSLSEARFPPPEKRDCDPGEDEVRQNAVRDLERCLPVNFFHLVSEAI